MLYGSVGRVGLRALSGTSFSPLSLFANGEQGVWYQNSDFTTLFQDAAGTTPVTGYEQFVGLRLDKSKGLVLGSELVTNGDFSNGTTGWSAPASTSLSVVGGQLKAEVTSGVDAAYFGQSVSVVAGKWYEVKFATISDGTSKIARLFVGVFWSGTAITPNAFGSYTVKWQATSTGNVVFWPYGTVGGTGTYILCDNISVRELPGNHAFQSTTTARAVLSARYNLLTRTEEFDNAAWTKSGTTASGKKVTAQAGTGVAAYIETGVTNAPAASITLSCIFPATTGRHRYVWMGDRGVAPIASATFDLNAVSVVGKETSATATAVTLSDGSVRCTLTYTRASVGTSGINIALAGSTYTADRPTGTWTGSEFLDMTADLRVSNDGVGLPAYQRVGAAVNGTSTSIGTPDYDTVGFPAYLRYDGGDWYQTNSIDFSTGATNPPLGPELVTNGDFSDGSTGWTNASTGTGTVSFTGGVATIVGTSSANRGAISQAAGFVVGRFYRVTFTVVRTSGILYVMAAGVGGSGGLVISASGTYSFTHTAPSTSFVVFTDGSGASYTIDSISVKEIDQNYAPDKMSVFAGVRKLSDAASAILVELSSSFDTNNGSFGLLAPSNNGNNSYRMTAGGTGRVSAGTGVFAPAPDTAILSAFADISGDIVTLRYDAQLKETATADQGTGNFGNYPLYIGARAGTSAFYNGREYGLIVLGRAVTATELANTEGYMEAQTFGKDMQYVYSDELTTATGDPITAADGDPIYMTVTYS